MLPASRRPAYRGVLLQKGSALLPNGHRVRLAVFAGRIDEADPTILTISLGHVLAFPRAYIDEHWTVLRHGDSTDPAFRFLMTLAKAERGDW